ncbi:MAG: hypothetical protein P8X57_04265 [Cyclobacteriaceae bacterium]
MNRLLLILLVPFIFAGCSSESERLHNEVMAIHDEVMPRMDDIMKEKARLTVLMEETDDSIRIVQIRTAMAELEAADEGMMQWMRQFSPEEYESSEEELTGYYEQEKVRIEEVRTNMLNALENSESIN